MVDIKKMATAKARESPFTPDQWSEALQQCEALSAAAVLNERAFTMLADAAQSPRQLDILAEMLQKHQQDNPEANLGFSLIAKHVDDSPYSLADWVESLEFFHDWLAQSSRPSPGLGALLGYLECCAQAGSSAPPGYPLQSLLEDMLARYGL